MAHVYVFPLFSITLAPTVEDRVVRRSSQKKYNQTEVLLLLGFSLEDISSEAYHYSQPCRLEPLFGIVLVAVVVAVVGARHS